MLFTISLGVAIYIYICACIHIYIYNNITSWWVRGAGVQLGLPMDITMAITFNSWDISQKLWDIMNTSINREENWN